MLNHQILYITHVRARTLFSHFGTSPEYSDILWYDLCMIQVPLCSYISTRGSFYLDAQEVRVTMPYARLHIQYKI